MKQVIRTGHHVESADGSRYIVRYVNGDVSADLSPLTADGDWNMSEYLTLPLGELTRVPVTKRVPIEGVPEQRPRCPFCDKPLQPELKQIREDGKDRYDTTTAAGALHWTKLRVVKKVFTGWKGYPVARGNAFDKFCTLGCARAFANAAFVAGYRIKRTKE